MEQPANPTSTGEVHTTFADVPPERRTGAVSEMRLDVELQGDRLRGHADVSAHMWLPGTDVVRTSVLTVWADNMTGMLAGESAHPRITVTLDLEVQLLRPLRGTGTIQFESHVLKPGRQVTVVGVRAWDDDRDQPFAMGVGSFVASPNPHHVAPPGGFLSLRGDREWPALTVPVAERAGVARLGGGVATIPHVLDNINATGSIHGGLLSLAAEEAILDARPGSMVVSLGVRYMRAFRSTATATATVHGDVAFVDLRSDEGALGSLTTARLCPLPSLGGPLRPGAEQRPG